MHTLGKHSRSGTDRTHLIKVATIHPFAVLKDLLAHQGFGERFEIVRESLAVGTNSNSNRIGVLETLNLFRGCAANGIQLFVTLSLGLLELAEHLTN